VHCLAIDPEDPSAADALDCTADGRSQYKGDIEIDLDTLWVSRASLDEYQIAETLDQTSGSASTEYTVRHVTLRVRTVELRGV